MRKRSISNFFDSFLWYLLYLLPVFMFLILTIVTKKPYTFAEIFDLVGLNIVNNSVVYTSLVGVCGASGVFPMFATSDVLIYLTYFIYVYIAHLLVDFILFIPKLSHKWLSKFTGGDN